MSRLSESVPGEPGRLYAPLAGANCSIQGGEATEGSAAEGENLRKPETFSQREGSAEEPGVRRRTAAEIGRSRSKLLVLQLFFGFYEMVSCSAGGLAGVNA